MDETEESNQTEEPTPTLIPESTPTSTPIPKKSKSKSSTPSPQTESCKVLWITPNSFAVSFKNYGIEIPKEPDLEINSDYVTIQYTSDIGSPDFTYTLRGDK